MHRVGGRSVVWYGGTGHRFLSMDDNAIQCYRCGDALEWDAWQEYVGDCRGPSSDEMHHWLGGVNENECALCDARQGGQA